MHVGVGHAARDYMPRSLMRGRALARRHGAAGLLRLVVEAAALVAEAAPLRELLHELAADLLGRLQGVGLGSRHGHLHGGGNAAKGADLLRLRNGLGGLGGLEESPEFF